MWTCQDTPETPLPPFWWSPPTLPLQSVDFTRVGAPLLFSSLQCRCFLRARECFARESAMLKLRHKIKDGGYNNTNINKQLLPAKNTPALQANYFSDETILCQIFKKEFWKLNQSFKLSGRVSKEPHRLIDERLLKHPRHSMEEKLLVSTGYMNTIKQCTGINLSLLLALSLAISKLPK